CAALGDYHGVLRELILAYKEQGRHALARPLGRLLASVVASLLPADAAGRQATAGVVLVPVPDTPAAARARHGDHMWRLARPAAAALRSAGTEVVLCRALRRSEEPRLNSSHVKNPYAGFCLKKNHKPTEYNVPRLTQLD